MSVYTLTVCIHKLTSNLYYRLEQKNTLKKNPTSVLICELPQFMQLSSSF